MQIAWPSLADTPGGDDARGGQQAPSDQRRTGHDRSVDAPFHVHAGQESVHRAGDLEAAQGYVVGHGDVHDGVGGAAGGGRFER